VIEVSYIRRPNRPLTLYAWAFLTLLYLPVFVIPLFSVNDAIYVRFPLQGFTTAWYRELLGRESVWSALANSLRVGLPVAAVSTALGLLAAMAISRRRLPGQSALVAFIMLPLVIPGIIFGVALLVLMSRLGVPLSLWTVALGHLIVCLPFAVATLLPRFEGFDPAIREASADLGENGWWTFWRVTLPMALPGVVASFLLCFTVSLDEFIMSFFLSGTDPTLPLYIWSQLRFPQQFPSVLALASIILAASFALAFVALRLARIGLDRPGAEP
jgi:spermidine/putrescine transport system permease protein